MSDFSFKHLEDHVVDGEFRPPTKKESGPHGKTERFPCQTCAGTGKWRLGRNSKGEDKCFACGGRGYFMTSPHDRAKARMARAQRKAKKIETGKEAVMEAHGEVIAQLREIANWNDFAASLINQLNAKGSLSSKQIESAERMLAKIAAKRAEKAKAEPEKVVDLARVREIFETARGNGLKRPVLRIGDLTLSRAADNSRNPGAIYVKRDGEYEGKVTPGGEYRGRSADTILPALRELAENPLETAVAYGRRTGTCACCGRELTNAESIELGIGPVCRSKWGL